MQVVVAGVNGHVERQWLFMVVGRPFVTAGETGPIRRIPVLRYSDIQDREQSRLSR